MIEQIWTNLNAGQATSSLSSNEIQHIEELILQMDQGKIRVCELQNNEWTVNESLKKAILIYFRIKKNKVLNCGDIQYFDKVPVKTWTEDSGVRVVPPAVARFGSFIEPGAILMPSYINIGAYVGTGTMVDTWATVGSCAQIGKHVHLSGGVGIGGVLEPVQAKPVIIEDHVFIGSRCIIVEGAHIATRAVIGAGVTITSSTKIIDVTQEKSTVYHGYVPTNSVVIPGTTLKKYPAGEFGVSCALIIGKRKESTDLKTSLNQALRDYF
jgi:2,3,4,5-tetrahydropyridine-2,6-dicarboxylate N-succinyltransferase